MTNKINYTKQWLPIDKALCSFHSFDDFVSAVSDNMLITRGRIRDERSPEEPENYSLIAPQTWIDYAYYPDRKYLENEHYEGERAYSRPYHHIEVGREKLLLLLLRQRYSVRSSELTNVICNHFISLYASKGFQELPSAPEVWRSLESNQEKIPCIIEFGKTNNNERKIVWEKLDGTEGKLIFLSFKNNTIKKIRDNIKEIENNI